MDIQSETHCSEEDAHAALALYRLYERLVSDGTFDSTLANLYEMGRKLNWQQKLRTAVLPEEEPISPGEPLDKEPHAEPEGTTEPLTQEPYAGFSEDHENDEDDDEDPSSLGYDPVVEQLKDLGLDKEDNDGDDPDNEVFRHYSTPAADYARESEPVEAERLQTNEKQQQEYQNRATGGREFEYAMPLLLSKPHNQGISAAGGGGVIKDSAWYHDFREPYRSKQPPFHSDHARPPARGVHFPYELGFHQQPYTQQPQYDQQQHLSTTKPYVGNQIIPLHGQRMAQSQQFYPQQYHQQMAYTQHQLASAQEQHPQTISHAQARYRTQPYLTEQQGQSGMKWKGFP